MVTHRPILPAAREAVTVFARVSDPDGLNSVLLQYRLDPSSTLTSVLMVPRGAGWFSASLPGQAAGALAAFRILADDSTGVTATFPG